MRDNSPHTVRGRRPRRSGAAAVEFALTAPVLFLFLFAGIEFARANMVLHSIENAAYEGARRGMVPGATASDCSAAAQALLDITTVTDATITVVPSTITPNTAEITVTIQAPMNMANGYVTPQFYLGKTLQSTITLSRELR